MSEPTMSVKIREWSEPLEEGQTWDDWPRPNEHVEYRITGNLADMIRERTGESGDVIFDEVIIEGGYSEWTVEYDYEVTIKVGAFSRTFDGAVEFDGGYRSALPSIQRWLESGDSVSSEKVVEP